MLVLERDDRVKVKNTTGKDIKSGELVKVGNWYGIAYADIHNGEEGILMVRGVFNVPVNDPATELKTGEKLTYSNGKVKKAGNNDVVIGKVFESKPAGKTEVLITLMPELY